MRDQGTINLFVYGTLRAGEINAAHFGLQSLAKEVLHNVSVRGAMYNVAGDEPIYPVVDFYRAEDGATMVKGDVLVGLPLDAGSVQRVIAMELRVGYTLVNVQTSVKTDGPVSAFDYDTLRRGPVGVRIPDGDWLRFNAAARVA